MSVNERKKLLFVIRCAMHQFIYEINYAISPIITHFYCKILYSNENKINYHKYEHSRDNIHSQSIPHSVTGNQFTLKTEIHF